MAIYHLNAKTRNSGAGKPACLYILRSGKYADPTKYSPAVFIGQGGLPAWAATAVDYFAAADKYEEAGKTRGIKAQKAKAKAAEEGKEYKATEGKAIVAVSMDIAIPAELSEEQRRACALDIVERITQTSQGTLPHAYALHAPDSEGDERNHHLHIMLGFRPDDHCPRPHPSMHFGHAARGADKSKGGAKKSKDLGSWSWLKKTRQIWQDIANQHLQEAGLDERIDCRTNKERGIDAVPGKHLGPLATAVERAKQAAEQARREAENSAKAAAGLDELAKQAAADADAKQFEAQQAAEEAHRAALAELEELSSCSPVPRPR